MIRQAYCTRGYMDMKILGFNREEWKTKFATKRTRRGLFREEEEEYNDL